MFSKLKNFVYTSKEKAAVAFIVSTVGAYMAQNGLTYKDLLSWSALWALLTGVATHLFVYFVTNSRVES